MLEYGFSLTCFFPCSDKIYSFIFIQENTGQWKERNWGKNHYRTALALSCKQLTVYLMLIKSHSINCFVCQFSKGLKVACRVQIWEKIFYQNSNKFGFVYLKASDMPFKNMCH